MKTLLNHDLCKIRVEGSKTCLYIRMENGQYAVQRPFENDLRGHIGALTLALDVLAGKVLLTGMTTLQERDFKENDSIETKAIEAPKTIEILANEIVKDSKVELYVCRKCKVSQSGKQPCNHCGYAFFNHEVDGKFVSVFFAKKEGA